MRVFFYFVYLIVGAIVLTTVQRPLSFALGFLILFLAVNNILHAPVLTVYRERNFFGTLKVIENKALNLRIMLNGTTLHGAQSLDKKSSLISTYYQPTLEVLNIIKQRKLDKSIAVIGLGVGTISCLAPPPEFKVTFFEIDPTVKALASNAKYFTYLTQCPPTGGIILGDGRLSLEKSKHRFSAIIMDAFSSDAIPTHLLTLEAIELYMKKLNDHGVLIVHISNRYLSLLPVLSVIANKLNLSIYVKTADTTTEEIGNLKSEWVLMTRTSLSNENQKIWKTVSTENKSPLWTDDYSNILHVLK